MAAAANEGEPARQRLDGVLVSPLTNVTKNYRGPVPRRAGCEASPAVLFRPSCSDSTTRRTGVKPPPFDYIAAHDVDHALGVLAQASGEAKILAGGQSLIPMMNFRLVTPRTLVDINRIPGIDQITPHPDRLTFGALVRHRTTATDASVTARFPVLEHAMIHVAHHTIRNRGTFVGSLCHADPAAEMPMIALLLNAHIQAASVRGKRWLRASEFFLGPLVTALEPDEMVTAVDVPNLPPDTGWGFEEFGRRRGDYALAAAGVTMARQAGCARDVRIALMGIGGKPTRIPEAESVLNGNDIGRLAATVDAVRGAIEPNSDLHASSDYRRHLAGVLVGRAVAAAWRRAS
jgi:CO/xanthine dehydrogenase FAD-binding subunit